MYNWSSLRSAYLAEADVDLGPSYIAGGGYGLGWYGAGWYWDPWFSAYTFIPGDGIFYSPFGWGFYSPFFAFDAPIFFDGGHFHHHFDPNHRGGDRGVHYNPGVRGGGFILVMDMQRRRADMLVMASAAVALADFTAAGSLAAEVASMGAVVVDLEAEGTAGKDARLCCEVC